jgi:Dehydrogenases with different specificities (related to short-chain alcohol dehydrogenases)
LESQNCPGKLIPLKGDVTKEEDIMTCFDWVNRNFGGVDVLINNAGVTVKAPLSGELETYAISQKFR